ncbi:MAG: ABC transporter ATP-binding protein [Acidimicrobiales bacterium]
MERPHASSFRRGSALLVTAVRNHPLPFTVSIIGASIYGVSVVFGAVVIGQATDDLIIPVFQDGVDPAAADIVRVVALIMAFALLRIVSVVFRRFFAGMAHAQMKAALRVALAERYLQVSLRFHRDRSAGELLSRADNDVQMAAEVVNPLPFTLGVLMMVVVAIVRLAILDVYMLGIALLLIPILGVANHLYTRLVEEPAAAVQREVAEVSATAHESFDGVMVVKTLGREEAEVQRVGEKADRLRVSRIRVGSLRASYEPALELVPVAGTIIVLAIGAWRVGAGGLTAGEVVEVMTLFTLMAFPLRVVGYLLEEMPYSVVAMDRVTEFLAEPDDPQPRPGEDLPGGALSLRLDEVSFAYEQEVVLDRLDVEVNPGEIVAIVGSTGGGKSTLFDLVTRLARPTSGEIWIAGIGLEEVSSKALREDVALVFQETFLFADTVRDNITLGRSVSETVYRWALEVACVDEFLAVLPNGDATEVGERGVTLSGGQCQRIALARALVYKPRLLLLDDATSAIDPAIEAEILGHLRSDLDATTLIVAHRLSTIRLAERVLFLGDGRLRGDGTHSELLRDPDYEALVTAYEEVAGAPVAGGGA